MSNSCSTMLVMVCSVTSPAASEVDGSGQAGTLDVPSRQPEASTFARTLEASRA
jgi:hypothetical protein